MAGNRGKPRRKSSPLQTRDATRQRLVEKSVRGFLDALGVDDPYAASMPRIVARDWPTEVLDGYGQDPARLLKTEPIESFSGQMIIVRDVAFTSICCHHLLPFVGRAAIAYVPDRTVTGFSALGRVVDCFAHRFQTQERMTDQILQALNRNLKPKGVAVRLEAEQLCMCSRGPKKHGARVVTTAFTGVFRSSRRQRDEFLRAAGL